MPATRVCPSCTTPLPDQAAFCFMCGTATPQGINQITGEMLAATGEPMASRELARLQKALGSSYILGEMIGRGGFADVFVIHDQRLKRDLALKALRTELTFSDQLMARFRREAETVAALRHPHIVPIYDIGEAEGVMYIIMPLIQGESLRGLLAREGPRPPREALRILREAADALGAAHDAGVVHRDVKPENIMLEGKGRRVQLMDFGIAKALDASEGSGLTSTGILVGTPHYMSPEQASGELNLDHRSDQYSLAVVGYQMITGELPFDGETTRAVLFQQMVGVPRSLRDLVPDVPANLAFSIERALSKEPGARYPSMEAFREALDGPDTLSIGPSEPAAATAPANAEAPTQELPAARRRPVRWMPLAGAAAVLAAASLGYALLGRGSIGPAEEALAADSAAVDTTVAAAGSAIAGPPVEEPAPTLPAVPAPATGSPGRVAAAPARTQPAAAPPPPRPAVPTTCAAAVRASNWELALDLCGKEAEGGSVSAMREMASLYRRGSGVAASDSATAAWFRRAAAAGDGQSAYDLGLMLAATPGNPAREAEATRLLRQAADANVRDAWPVVAERYEQGLGVRRNDQEAAFWYRKAAAEGNQAAQYNLGSMYARGRGVSKSEPEAAEWYARAAEQGHTAAQFELGMAYIRGRGVAKSDSLGLLWLERAASQGHPEATREVERRRRP